LYLKLHPETKHGGAPGKAGGGKKAKDAKLASFVKDTAKKTGKAKRTIARDVSRGEKIDPRALADLAGTCLDNGTELDALAKLPPPEQRGLASRGRQKGLEGQRHHRAQRLRFRSPENKLWYW